MSLNVSVPPAAGHNPDQVATADLQTMAANPIQYMPLRMVKWCIRVRRKTAWLQQMVKVLHEKFTVNENIHILRTRHYLISITINQPKKKEELTDS